jgi:hypothetical protein
MSTETQVRGSCACGHITYTSTSQPRRACDCHCLECRKISGSPYITFIGFPRSSITYSHPPKTIRLSTVAERAFCDQCGSTISMWYSVNDNFGIAAGSLDEESMPAGTLAGLERPRIFLQEKAGWYDIPEDGAPKFERFQPGFDEKLGEWRRTGASFARQHGEGK